MVKLMTKPLGIHLIFAKETNGNYTKDALLYQDILRYSVRDLEPVDNSDYLFRIWELTKWLLSENEEMSNYYKKSADSHMTMSNKIENRIIRVKKFVDMLGYLGLLGEHGQVKERKGEGMTTLYSFTEFGLIVALLILMTKASKKQKAIELLYRTLRKNFQNSGSIGEFCLSFTKKMYEGKLLEKYLSTMLATAERNNSIIDINDFFANSLLLELNEVESKRFLRMKGEAFNGLSPEMKKRFMHLKKLEIEERMYKKLNNFENFEKTRFEIRNDYEKIVIEGFCQNCNLYHVMKLSLVEYLSKVNYREYETRKCPICEKENSIKIPSIRI